MARYTQLVSQEVEKIAAAYGLDVEGFEAIDGGAGNSSYLLATGQGNYVLTVFDDKSHAHAARTGRLLQLLEKHSIPSSQLLPTLKREVVSSFQGKPVMIKRYIQGKVCKKLNLQQLQQLGMIMAQLHDVPAPGLLDDEHSYGLQRFSTISGTKISPGYEKWLAEKGDYIAGGLATGIPKGFIHGDLFYDNALFEDSQLKAIIDFEEACYYYRSFDLGMGLVGLCSTTGSLNLVQGRALMGGYQQVRELQPDEKEAMQLFSVYAATATSYWRFWKFNIHMPDKDKRDHYRLMMRLADSIQEISAQQFYRKLFN